MFFGLYIRRLTDLTSDTLIVWTEPLTSIDMALSFQESEGCNAIWYVDLPHTKAPANLPRGLLSATSSSNYWLVIQVCQVRYHLLSVVPLLEMF